MYKKASTNLQRSHRVIQVRASPSTYVCDDDLIQSAENMGLRECEAERRDLLTEKTRLENELIGAKASNSEREIRRIGHRLSGIAARLGMLRKRIKEINRAIRADTFTQAAKELLPPETLQAIYARQSEIIDQNRRAS